MAVLRIPRRGRSEHHGADEASRSEPLEEMAAQVRELDASAVAVAARIAAAAEELRNDQIGAGSVTRTDLLAGLASALVERTEEIRADCERLSALMDRTARLIADRDRGAAGAEDESADETEDDADDGSEAAPGIDPAPGAAMVQTSDGVRLIATQMAIAGSSRGEIERRLRIQFGVRDADQALDEVFGTPASEAG